MQNRINKPRVFLSHASLDKSFIKKLASDLRECQIEPWLDTEEIRDGKPWLKVIFEEGIPACDAIIVYLTENSLNSKMVAKELDATLVEELVENGIRILPYISKTELRGRLRSDVKTLQCREWNDTNYHEIFPTVVAEIWRSYMERIVNSAILQERNRRLELELELKKIEETRITSVFSESEDREFTYIKTVLDRDVEISSEIHQKVERGITTIGKEVFNVNLLRSFIYYVDKGSNYFDSNQFSAYLMEALNKQHPEDLTQGITRSIERRAIKENLTLELKTYGLLRLTKTERFNRYVDAHEISEKMYRFKYWLGFNNQSVEGISFEQISFVEINQNENSEVDPSENQEISYAKRVAQDVSFQDQRKKWLTTEIGISSARQEMERLYSELEGITKSINGKVATENALMEMELSQKDKDQISLSCRGLSLSIAWSCESNNMLENPVLFVQGYKSKSNMEDGNMDTDGFYKAEYKIDVDREMNVFWKRNNAGGEKPMSTTDLAKSYINYLLSSVRSHNE